MSKCFVITVKSSFMQRIADLVRTGHRWYVTGEISHEKLDSFYDRMNHIYEVNLSNMQSSRKRKSGRAGFKLLVASLDDDTKIYTFFLLRSFGDMPVEATNEKWKDALREKIEVRGYNLVRKTREGSKSPSWTWSYTKEQYHRFYDGITMAIRQKGDKNLTALILSISKTQGFAGARAQAYSLLQLIKDEWKRSRGNDIMPELPKRISYNRRVATLGRVVEEVNKKRAIRKSSLKFN